MPAAYAADGSPDELGGTSLLIRFEEWSRACGLASAVLFRLDRRAKLNYLFNVLTYLRRRDDASGIEPILCSAINAAWPWIDRRRLEHVLRQATRFLRASTFASRVSVPVLDPNTRTFTVFGPGELAKADIEKWLDWRSLPAQGFDGVQGGPGAGSDSASDDVFGPGGVLGPGTPGHKGVDLSGLTGPDGKPRGSGQDLDSGLYGPGGLLGPGTPGHKGVDLSGLTGPDGKPRGSGQGLDSDLYGPGGLLGPGTPGHRSVDLSNLHGNGGPYGFASTLAPGGAETPEEAELAEAKRETSFGQALFIAGVAASVAGVAAAGLGSPAAVPLAVGAIVLLAGGAALYIHGERKEDKIEKEKPGKTDPSKSLYPDPFGDGSGNPTAMWDENGGGGSPNTIWDENGGGGSPNTIWDENGGGGNPTTIWNENGGGVGPTTVAAQLAVVTLVGSGLLSRIELVGPHTFSLALP